MEQLTAYSEFIFLGLMGALALVLILILTLWVKLSRMRRNYMHLLNGAGSTTNMEEVLIGIQTSINRLQHEGAEQAKILDAIQQRLRVMKARVGIHRYNAFADRGSDLSFSIAILNELQDGIVITGIHNREDTYIYAKPIERGDSKYNLSPEEKEAISRSS